MNQWLLNLLFYFTEIIPYLEGQCHHGHCVQLCAVFAFFKPLMFEAPICLLDTII